MKNKHFFYMLFLAILFSSCAGSINTIRHTSNSTEYKKAFIVAAESSQYIRNKTTIVYTAIGFMVIPEAPAETHEIIGNTGEIIKQELAKYGISAELVKNGEVLEDFDLLVEYYDTWHWDFKKVLDKLEIAFISPKGERIAESTYKTKELHNYPIPEKEIPKMIRELLKK